MFPNVQITKGFYRNNPVSGVFAVTKPYSQGARGGFITVRNPLPGFAIGRVNVEPGDFKFVDEHGNEVTATAQLPSSLEFTPDGNIVKQTVTFEEQFIKTETEDAAMDRIEETFLMLDRIVDAASKGVVRGLVVSGPPGVGKSFGVVKQLDAANMFRVMEGRDPMYDTISGGISPIGLYQKLYNNRDKQRVLVFDDCDGALFDEECLNLLKAALNSGDSRRICWNKESRTLSENDIPDSFDFEGSIIFLSNIDFERTIAKGSRIAAHLEAIMSRCHYLDLEISSMRDKLLRIKQIVRDGMLEPYDFSKDEEADIIDYVMDNAEFLREVSLRVVKKIADLAKADPINWRNMAEATVLTREAKFKRLLVARSE